MCIIGEQKCGIFDIKYNLTGEKREKILAEFTGCLESVIILEFNDTYTLSSSFFTNITGRGGNLLDYITLLIYLSSYKNGKIPFDSIFRAARRNPIV